MYGKTIEICIYNQWSVNCKLYLIWWNIFGKFNYVCGLFHKCELFWFYLPYITGLICTIIVNIECINVSETCFCLFILYLDKNQVIFYSLSVVIKKWDNKLSCHKVNMMINYLWLCNTSSVVWCCGILWWSITQYLRTFNWASYYLLSLQESHSVGWSKETKEDSRHNKNLRGTKIQRNWKEIGVQRLTEINSSLAFRILESFNWQGIRAFKLDYISNI